MGEHLCVSSVGLALRFGSSLGGPQKLANALLRPRGPTIKLPNGWRPKLRVQSCILWGQLLVYNNSLDYFADADARSLLLKEAGAPPGGRPQAAAASVETWVCGAHHLLQVPSSQRDRQHRLLCRTRPFHTLYFGVRKVYCLLYTSPSPRDS